MARPPRAGLTLPGTGPSAAHSLCCEPLKKVQSVPAKQRCRDAVFRAVRGQLLPLPARELSVVVGVLGVAGFDFAEHLLVLADIVLEGEEELFGVLRAHDDAAYDGSLGHTRSGEDEVHEELVGAVADHCEVAVFAVGNFRTELNLKLVLVILFVFHFM